MYYNVRESIANKFTEGSGWLRGLVGGRFKYYKGEFK